MAALLRLVIGIMLIWGGAACAQSSPPQPPRSQAPPPHSVVRPPRTQIEIDAYTRYELLDPGSGKFRITYEVTDATPGATAYFNPIRKGSVASDERVSDRASGKSLRFDVVAGDVAQRTGLPEADPSYDYIRVQLARPVPAGEGQARVLIEKTYQDTKSYYADGSDLVFSRSLGIKRNAVVLPRGYELVACNFPSQVLQEGDGRIAISFLNDTPGEAPLLLRARAVRMADLRQQASANAGPAFEERAHQTRDIVYFLRPPESHAFDLYHDYTETKPGESRYFNVVRGGSQASNPSGVDLDTGEALAATILKGEAVARAGLPAGELATVTPDAGVVVFSFRPLHAGESARLRMRETYTDPASYRLDGDVLVFDRSLGRPANAVVLPMGWALTSSSVPAAVVSLPDGRVRLDLLNPRNDELKVVITARRRLP